MRIYNRNARTRLHYYLRSLRGDMTPLDWWSLLAAIAILLALLMWPAQTQAQPNECHCQPGGPGCVCAIGTIPPVSGIACDPAGGDISGCDKVFLMEVNK